MADSTFEQEAVRRIVCRVVCRRTPADRFLDRSQIRRAFLEDPEGRATFERSVQLGNTHEDPAGNMVDWYSAHISRHHPAGKNAEWVRCPECGTGLFRRREHAAKEWWSYRVAKDEELDRCR